MVNTTDCIGNGSSCPNHTRLSVGSAIVCSCILTRSITALVPNCFSMYVELIITNSTSAKSTVRALLDRVITTHSFPDAIRHDRGSGFTSKILDWLTRGLGVKRFIGSAMNPHFQGICEARVKLVSRSLRPLVNSRSGEWHCRGADRQVYRPSSFNMDEWRGIPMAWH